MELEMTCKGFRFKKPVLNAKFTKEETFEINLPETEPDAVRTVAAMASPLMRSKDAEAGRMSVTGVCDVAVIYVSDEASSIRTVNASRDFSAYADSAEVESGMPLIAQVSVVSAEARLINSRKIHVKVELLYALEAFTEESVSIPEGVSGGTVELLTEKQRVVLPYTVCEKTFSITDSQRLDAAADLVGQSVSFSVEDVRSVGSKAVVRGTAKTRILYINTSGRAAAATLDSPFSQIVELDCDEEHADYCVSIMATGLYASLDAGGDGEVSLEVHGVIQCVGYRAETVEYMTDAYSASGDLELSCAEMSFASLAGFDKVEAYASLEARTPQEVQSIDAILANTGCGSLSQSGVTVPTNITAVYTAESGEMFGQCRGTDAAAQIRQEEGTAFEIVSAAADDGNAEYNATPDGLAVRLAVWLNIKKTRTVTVKYISCMTQQQVECPDDKLKPSIIAYRVCRGDNLWQIGKRYRVPASALLVANGMESEAELKPGMLILIPKK